MNLSRRQFIGAMAAGAVVTAEGLWLPGEKLISIPSKKIFIPEGRLAWIEDGVTYMYAGGRGGGKTAIPSYFDIAVRGAEMGAEISDATIKFLRGNSGQMDR